MAAKKAETEQKKTEEKAAPKQARYFIVNPAGAVHEVTKEHARARLQQRGYRKATKAEVQALRDRNGHQVHDDPIAEPWNPEPEAMEDVD